MAPNVKFMMTTARLHDALNGTLHGALQRNTRQILHCTVQLCTVQTLFCTMHFRRCTVHILLQCTVQILHCTIHHCTVHILFCTMHFQLCTVNILQKCTVQILHCTVYFQHTTSAVNSGNTKSTSLLHGARFDPVHGSFASGLYNATKKITTRCICSNAQCEFASITIVYCRRMPSLIKPGSKYFMLHACLSGSGRSSQSRRVLRRDSVVVTPRFYYSLHSSEPLSRVVLGLSGVLSRRLLSFLGSPRPTPDLTLTLEFDGINTLLLLLILNRSITHDKLHLNSQEHKLYYSTIVMLITNRD